ncbi:MAG TPA: hybrid sensor histidine kinase/response regulator, partial [Mizugakiibacter sp.]|nr:hybrid sensor histidine kinase/response regulator [Mizugakiibacter sp.]
DFTTLGWVKSELDETLHHAREALEAYVDAPDDVTQMRFCTTDLHQVQGTLRMVELYGAAMVVAEMEKLARNLLDDAVPERDEAYTTLMRGMMQLPDYLERLQSGHRDVPVVLLPLLNSLRSCQGQTPLGEVALFTPDLSVELPEDAPRAVTAPTLERQRTQWSELRLKLQLPLLAWIRNQGDACVHVAAMRQVLDQIANLCFTIPGRRLWWIAGGVLEGLELGLLNEHSVEVKRLIGKVDRNIRKLIEGGEVALAHGEAEGLACSLLYYVARAESGSERLAVIFKTYHLERLLPSKTDYDNWQATLSGRNRELLDTVSKAIKEDLLRVKEALDLFLRNPEQEPQRLVPQAESLGRVADTLGMLGLNVLRRVVGEERKIIDKFVAGERLVNAGALLDVAGALLYVEASLDDHIERLGMDDEDEVTGLPKGEARHISDAVLKEAAANLSKVKDGIIAFIESPWDHTYVLGIPPLLDEARGALGMLETEHLPELMQGIARFVHNELVASHKVPTTEQMDLLADAVASVEYFIEAAREQRPQRDRILDVTERSLAALGYWPVPAKQDMVVEPETTSHATPEPLSTLAVSEAQGPSRTDVFVGPPSSSVDETPTGGQVSGIIPPTATSAGGATVDSGSLPPHEGRPSEPPTGEDAELGQWVEVKKDVLVNVPGQGQPLTGFHKDLDDVDDEIREVFIEEVGEEIENLQAASEIWIGEPEDQSKLRDIRRSFHTLKGSGRLVGASTLGEFSWKVEILLNHILDQSISAGPSAQSLVRHAVAALPALHAALRGEIAYAPLEAIEAAADRLSIGKAVSAEELLLTQCASHVESQSTREWVWQVNPEVLTEPTAAA